MAVSSDNTTGSTVRVRLGRVDSVDLYEIKDSELDLLEEGSPAGLQLNFAVFLLSLAFSAICSLATATFSNNSVMTIFIVVAVVGVLLGAYLLTSWYRSRQSIRELCKIIRGRIPPDVAPPVSDDSPVSDEDDIEKPAG